MKKIMYKVLSHTLAYNQETETVEQKECFTEIIRDYSEANEEIAKREAYEGKYIIDEDGSRIVAPHNITAGEYVTIDGVLYLATQNIPSGEPVIAGQNATVTTVEQQLYELKGE